jgi:hypothetical protein
MKLYAKDGTQLKIGTEVNTFRGEKATVRAMYQPHHSGSTGRVLLRFEDGSEGEYFPNVINARWREDPPYPFCRTPDKCAGKGYCPNDPACND